LDNQQVTEESEIFHELIKRLNKVIETIDKPIEVVLIDDGSNDEKCCYSRGN
jgi:hypothetical protein